MFWITVAILAGGLTLIAYTVNSVYDWGMQPMRRKRKEVYNMPHHRHSEEETSFEEEERDH